MPTKSEILFDEYCRRRGYGSKPIEAGSQHGKTPDRLVITQFGKVVVEIKELSPNEEDVRQVRELREKSWTSGGGTPGARVCRHIKKAAPQLKRFAHCSMPCVVVFFDNIVIDGMRPRVRCIHLDPAFIDFGMHGLGTVILAQETHERGNHLVHVADGRGGRRQMTETDRVYISAVAVLEEEPGSGELFLSTYHNYFASLHLPDTMFRGPLDRHYRKPAHPDCSPQTWEKVFPLVSQ